MLLLFFATSSPSAYSLTADAGAYTLLGQDAALVAALTMAAAEGAYTLTGQDADFAVTTAPPTPVSIRHSAFKVASMLARVEQIT